MAHHECNFSFIHVRNLDHLTRHEESLVQVHKHEDIVCVMEHYYFETRDIFFEAVRINQVF